MATELKTKLEYLRTILRNAGSVLVAYSGGVDSSLVMAIAHEQLRDNAIACIGVSPSYAKREMETAVDLAEELGVPYRFIKMEEYLDPNYTANLESRCYYCKVDLYDKLNQIAAAEGWNLVVDGANVSDLGDHRPGMAAAQEYGVRSPLIEADITKSEVRELARHLGLPVWDKPAMACLSSRVPHGTEITAELLRQIEVAEDVLVELGFRQFRVRHHDTIARIEVPPEAFQRVIEHRDKIVTGIRAAGYKFVTLDLTGYQQGSLSQLRTTDVSVEQISIT